MRTKKHQLIEGSLMAIGLLLVTLPQAFRYHVHISDLLLGGIVGIGLGLQITALILSKKFRRSGHF